MKNFLSKKQKQNSKNSLSLQLIKFGVVGVVAALVDVGTLIILKEFMGLGVLISSAIAFSVSVCVNYILSMAFVFKSKKQSKVKEFILFVLLSIGGLCLDQIILWVGITYTSVYYLVVKIFAMVIVPVYNFITRKIFLESKENECEK